MTASNLRPKAWITLVQASGSGEDKKLGIHIWYISNLNQLIFDFL